MPLLNLLNQPIVLGDLIMINITINIFLLPLNFLSLFYFLSKFRLTHFSPVSHFIPPENVRKPFLGGIEM